MASNRDGDLAAAVHETTNALTVILGWIERARSDAEDCPGALSALGHAERYALQARDGMRTLIGASVPSTPPEPAGALSSRVVEDLEVEARRAGVTITLELAPAARDILVAAPRTAWQVLTNLLLNAIAMSPAGSTVTLETVDASDWVSFHVRDDGPGIPESRRDTLFSCGESGRRGGAGIGLRHAHDLAAEAGGKLVLRDRERGAHFVLTLPKSDATHAYPRRTDTKLAPISLQGARVLLLEDDAAVVELLELTLGARGAELTTVRDAVGLEERLNDGVYDLLLVDLSPLTAQRGGVVTEDQGLAAALDKARTHNPDIGVIVISGSVTVQPREDIIWVRKPFEPRELVEAIAKHRVRS